MPIFYTKNMNKLYTKGAWRCIFLKKLKKITQNTAVLHPEKCVRASYNPINALKLFIVHKKV